MSDLTKNKTANALVWAAFLAFWFHSLHCCRTHTPNERCVFDYYYKADCRDAFHCSQRNTSRERSDSCVLSPCRRFPLFAPSEFKRTVAPKTPTFVPRRDVLKSRCLDACPSLRLQTEKKNFADFGAFSNRTFADASTNDLRFLSAVAFLNRFADARSTPLYLRLRKFLN